MKYFVTCSNW